MYSALALFVPAVLLAVAGVGRAGGPVARVGLLGGVSVGSSRGCFFTINRPLPLAERASGDDCCRCCSGRRV